MILVLSEGRVEGILKGGEWGGVVADIFWADGKIRVNKGTCDEAASAAEEWVGKEG
jgi:hypothetical protein